MIAVFKVDFTAWSNSTAVENHLVGKAIFGLVGNHIRLATILDHYKGFSIILRCFHVGSPSSDGFYRLVRCWTAVETYLVGKPIVGLVGIFIGSGHNRPLGVSLWVFVCIIWWFSPSPRRSASAAIPSFKNWVCLPPVRLVSSAFGLWILGFESIWLI